MRSMVEGRAPLSKPPMVRINRTRHSTPPLARRGPPLPVGEDYLS